MDGLSLLVSYLVQPKQEVSQAMHHVRCAKRGLPLPEPDLRPARNKSENGNNSEDAGPAQTAQHEHLVPQANAVRDELSPSPRRRSKSTSALDDRQQSPSGSRESAVSVDGLEYTCPDDEEDCNDHHAYQVRTHGGESFSAGSAPILILPVIGRFNFVAQNV